jgi:hypothetical protein
MTTLQNTIRNYVEEETVKLGLTRAEISEEGKLYFGDIDFGDECAGSAIIGSELLNNLPSVFDRENLAYAIDTAAMLEDEMSSLNKSLKEYMLLEQAQSVSLSDIRKIIEQEYARLEGTIDYHMTEHGNDISHLLSGDY